MKKNLLILLSILCTLLFTACGKETELKTESPRQDYFNASVLEIKNHTNVLNVKAVQFRLEVRWLLAWIRYHQKKFLY